MTTSCDMPTDTARLCTRPARFAFVAKDGTIVARYCRQHAQAHGRSAILRPRPWEYVALRDLRKVVPFGA